MKIRKLKVNVYQENDEDILKELLVGLSFWAEETLIKWCPKWPDVIFEL